jgi:diguanylate cyclase (GGDEF)-like protein
VARADAGGTDFDPLEVVVSCQDGIQRNVLFGYRVIGEEDLAWGIDLTDRRRAEERLRETLADLERVNGELRASQARLAEMATHDPLTGLYNRREMDRYLLEEIARADRYGSEVTLLVMDLDHFKRINDTCGHLAGDQVLAQVASVLTRTTRPNDRAIRYGGEEFAIIAPSMTAAQGQALAERIRCNVAETPFVISLPDGRERRLSLTISIGLASLPEHAHDAHALFLAADAALYQAKLLGRNRVEEAQSDATLMSDRNA